ncbi:PHP domain-containing protein [Clostridium carnis]
MYTKGDFHIHTICSDGAYTPTEIVIMARESKLDIISITDHNTTIGIDEAIKAGEWLGVKVIPGIELSTSFYGKKAHILGYFTTDIYKNNDFSRLLKYIKKHNIKSVKNFIGNSIEIRKSNNKEVLDTNLGIDLIKYFGGCAILAHPVRLKSGIFNEIIKLPFDGIEAIYSKNTPSQTEYYKKISTEKDMIYTAGSDFHTDLRMDRRHGKIGQVSLDNYEIENLLIKCINSSLKN